MPIPDDQLGAALRRLLTRHGIALLAPDDHSGTGYAWYDTGDPAINFDAYANLTDLDAARAHWQQAIAVSSATSGAQHPVTLAVQAELADLG